MWKSDTFYQVDDKCGSFWQRLPVSWSGRDSKDDAKSVYRFAIHSNVVCGERGLMRFAVVPKNITTGSNFGLTNLICTLLAAKESGRLAEQHTHLVRHTDGGPDNVAVVTQFVHWLLVYLGVFQKVTWFRFDAGHSHTEICDRLFAVIKRHFESDGRHRVEAIDSFPELFQKLEKEFEGSAESSQFAFHLANWDLKTFMEECNVVSSKLKNISTKKAFEYSYAEELWEHGCVKVQYKDDIAYKGSAREAEWSPIETIEEEMPTMDGEGSEKVKVNVSKPRGVRFIMRPPDLRIPPRKDPFKKSEDGDETTIAENISRLLRKRDLPEEAQRSWKALEKLHAQGPRAEALPDMPQTVEVDGHPFTFHGCPLPFAESMKKLMRFPRPLLPADPFTSPPADTWEAAKEQDQGATPLDGEAGRQHPNNDGPEDLRDPRRENTVEDEENSGANRRRELRQVAEEDFATDTPTRVEEVKVGELYLMELEVAELGVCLGLAIVEAKLPERNGAEATWRVAWFVHSTKAGFRSKNPAFKQHKRGSTRATDEVSIGSFRLLVGNRDMTSAGVKEKESKPKLKESFALKVMAFAKSEDLLVDEDGSEISEEDESGGEDLQSGNESNDEAARVASASEHDEGEEVGEAHPQAPRARVVRPRRA